MHNVPAKSATTKGKAAKFIAGTEVRASAARVIADVLQSGQSLTAALQKHASQFTGPDKALLQELSFGCLRVLPRLQYQQDQLLHSPLPANEGLVSALFKVGLYQLTTTRIPPHAAISTTVDAAKLLGKHRFASLLNACLRGFQRQPIVLDETKLKEETKWLFPAWLIQQLRTDWPTQWQEIIAASNDRAPMSVAINQQRIAPDDYQQQLLKQGMTFRPIPAVPTAIMLDTPFSTTQLPGFAEGEVWIQDAHAQLASQFLAPQKHDMILDCCAAPGGKTASIANIMPYSATIYAMDQDAERLGYAEQLFARLGFKATFKVGDALQASKIFSVPSFDCILLDAPCSGTGVIRRHPDIKWLRRASDITQLTHLQEQLLEGMWQSLKPGGRMLYATCSLLQAENEEQISTFLARHQDAQEIALSHPWALPRNHGVQFFPAANRGDGFYYALLSKLIDSL